MAYESNYGIQKLISVLDNRMAEHGKKPLVLDFGEIREDGCLLTNTFSVPIPKSGYRVCRSLMIGNAGDPFCDVRVTVPDGTGEGSAYIPERMRKLKPGDRVLVAWVQNIAVVVDIILNP